MEAIIENGEIKIYATTTNGTRENILDFMDSGSSLWVRKNNINFDCVSGFELVYGNTKWFSNSNVGGTKIVIGFGFPTNYVSIGDFFGQSFITDQQIGGELNEVWVDALKGKSGISRSEYENGLSNSKVQIREYVNNNETGQNHALTGQILAISTGYGFTPDDQGGTAEDVVFEFSSNNPLILDPYKEYIIELVKPNNIEIHYDDNTNFYTLRRAYDVGGSNSNINKDIPFE